MAAGLAARNRRQYLSMVKQGFRPGRSAAALHGFQALTLATVLMISPAGSGQIFGHHSKEPQGTAPAETHNAEIPASRAPAFSIPVEPLGFFAPGAIYQGQRDSLVSLDFLDEDHLLFTFHAPGLIRREGNPVVSGERQVRSLVLALPSGAVLAEGLWTLHDRGRYLWMLDGGRFLLRDENDLKVGDSSLELTPLFHFRGPLLWVEMDPTQKLLVAESREPAEEKAKEGDVPSPGTASARIAVDGASSTGSPEIVLRILSRLTRQVMLVSRTRETVHLPINSEGYVETLRGKGHEWVLNLDFFKGGNRIIGKIDSMCAPSVEFVAEPEVLVTTCNPDNSRWMVAMSTDGKRLWNANKPPTQIWPRLVMAPNGLRLARETLLSTHAVNTYSPISFDDIKGQLVEVYDAGSGKIELTAPASPILDGGGNVAISPSARRVAILDSGAIQVYELPTPVPASQAAH